MSRAPSLVSIGLPVRNGELFLSRALKSLLDQSYPAIELIISDNASSDRTPEICGRHAYDPRVRYRRHASDIGAWPNFLGVLGQARGSYFMWASDDDVWSRDYIAELVPLLETNRDAVLATPTITYMTREGRAYGAAISSAPGTGRLDNLRVLYEQGAASWIYGLYRIGWLRAHAHELSRYPAWGGDMIWLAGACLRYQLCGSPRAMLYKRRGSGRFPPSRWDRIRLAPRMAWHLCSRSLIDGRGLREKAAALLLSSRHVGRRVLPFSLRQLLPRKKEVIPSTDRGYDRTVTEGGIRVPGSAGATERDS